MLVSGRTTNILLMLLLAVGVGMVMMLASGVRGGPLDPPAAPSATGTLPQVEPRMPIPPVGWDGSFPIVISQPGSYFLTRDIVGVALAPSWNGIEIAAGAVWLDLNGFTVAADGTGQDGIVTTAAVRGVKVSNGKVEGWGNRGIVLSNASESEVTGVIVSYTGGSGIVIGSGSKLTDCVSSHNPVNGVVLGGAGSVLSDCMLVANGQGLADFGTDNTIVRTTAANSSGNGFFSLGTRLTLTQNIARNNTGANYAVAGCTGCDIGPIGAAASSTSPWANISD